MRRRIIRRPIRRADCRLRGKGSACFWLPLFCYKSAPLLKNMSRPDFLASAGHYGARRRELAARVRRELNLAILKRARLAETRLQEGDKLEIIQMIGGG